MLLIDDLLLLPFKGLIGIFEEIRKMAERELTDEGYIQEKLMELQLRFELDEINEDEYNKQKIGLLAQLDSISKAKEE